MINGNNLRNTFNLSMRRLYNIDDFSKGSASGRSYTSKINSKSYVDIYIEMCYDEIDKYKNNELSDKDIIKFIEGIERLTLHFFDNNIKEETRYETRKLLREYLNEIIVSYDSSIVKKQFDKTMTSLVGFKKKDLFELSKKPPIPKINENSHGVNFNKGNYEKDYFEKEKQILGTEENNFQYEEESKVRESKQKLKRDNYKEGKKFKKKENKQNSESNSWNEKILKLIEKNNSNTHKKEKYVSKKALRSNSWNHKNTKINQEEFEEPGPVHAKEHYKKERSIPFTKIAIFAIIILTLIGIKYYINSFDKIEPIVIIENKSQIQQEKVLEKPPKPIIKEFTLNQIEEDLLNKLNERRIQYQKSKYVINMKLSELNNDYLYTLLTQDEEQAILKIGDLIDRGKQSKISNNLVETKYIFEKNITAYQILNNLQISNLYTEEYDGIGLAIIDYNNKTNVLISIYKNE